MNKASHHSGFERNALDTYWGVQILHISSLQMAEPKQYCSKRSNKKWASDPLSDLSSSFRSRKERCVVVVWRVMDSSVYWIFTKCDPSSVLMLRFDNFQYALALCALCRRSMYRSCIDHRPCAAYQNIHNTRTRTLDKLHLWTKNGTEKGGRNFTFISNIEGRQFRLFKIFLEDHFSSIKDFSLILKVISRFRQLINSLLILTIKTTD